MHDYIQKIYNLSDGQGLMDVWDEILCLLNIKLIESVVMFHHQFMDWLITGMTKIIIQGGQRKIRNLPRKNLNLLYGL